MIAIVARGKGGSEILEPQDVLLPWPARSGDVLVRLRAAGVNPADVFFRQLGGYVEGPGPFILGHDGAGTVEAVGGEVVNVTPGDHVCFCYGGIGATYGTYAQYAVVPADVLAVIPPSVDFVTAAALPLVFITLAESLYDRADVQSGEFALIHAGAGCTGHIGVQLAGLRGARVATTVGNARKAALARELGAELTISYRDQDFVTAARDWTRGQGIDVAFDNVGADVMRKTFTVMAPYGRIVTLTGLPGDTSESDAYNANLTIHNVMMLTPMWRGLQERMRAQARHVRRGLALLAEGRLRVVVDRVFPLREAAAAHDYLEGGHAIGKIVLGIE